jgi:transcriptional regulator
MSRRELTGHLDMLLLTIIADSPKHGYAVIEELRARSNDVFDLPEGTVYPALHRLEKAGLLASEWSNATGRRRRTYRLTRQGRTELGLQQQAWRRFAGAVGHVLEGQPWPAFR